MVEQGLPYRVILMTAGSHEEAERLARALVAERLAACVNVVGPIRSIYRWQGAVEESAEQLLIAKTRADLVAQLAERVRALHSYEVPEVLALPVLDGWPPYLAWVEAEIQAPGGLANPLATP
jgi:periplasmic divalent cation tolerance protein